MSYRAKSPSMKCSFCVSVNKFEKIYENSLNSVDVMVTSVIFKVHKGREFSKNSRLAALIQNVDLVMENKCVKFDGKSFNSIMAMAMSVFFKVLKGRQF